MISVLVVDDSAVVRKILTEQLSRFPDIEVAGSAADPFVAREQIARHRPDVLTLDIEMPRMDGLEFLSRLMKHLPIPVVIVSSLTPRHSQLALRALQMGAVEVIPKPSSQFTVPEAETLARAVRAASKARLFKRGENTAISQAAQGRSLPTPFSTTSKILAIGASTGGTTAIETILSAFPASAPATFIVQHMPAGFTRAFAERLDQVCKLRVREARDGDVAAPGLALVAPGGCHMLLKRSGAHYLVQLKDGPAVHYQRPSVDVFFYSVARNVGQNSVGVLLTGMGADGAKGLLAMKERGACTFAQDEASCVVFGMPGEAVKLGAAQKVVCLPNMAHSILKTFEARREALPI